jgi:hypothetical protein
LSKNIKIKIYRTKMLPVILYGCETCSLALREERRLRVFENRMLRKVLWSKRDEITGSGEDYITRSFVICTAHQILFGRPNKKDELGTACSWYGGKERCIQGLSWET